MFKILLKSNFFLLLYWIWMCAIFYCALCFVFAFHCGYIGYKFTFGLCECWAHSKI